MRIDANVVPSNRYRTRREPGWIRVRVLSAFCCAALLASCGDDVPTAPDSALKPNVGGAIAAARQDGERVTITRTTDAGPAEVLPGRLAGLSRRGHHWVRVNELSESLVASVPGDSLVAATSRSGASAAASPRARSADDAMRAMPLPDLTIPVRRGSSPLARNAWTRRRSSDIDGVTVELSGVGDAPASRVVMTKGGQELAVIKRTWRRRDQSWLLERQETTMPAGRYREVVEIKRTGTPSNVAAARAHLLTLKSMAGGVGKSAGTLDPFGATFDVIDCSGYDGSDQCAKERDNLEKANGDVDDAGIMLAIACLIPEPFEVAACQGAMAWLTSRVVKQENAKLALKRCEERAAQKARCCIAASRMPVAGGSFMNLVQAPRTSGHELAGCEDAVVGPGGGNPGDPGAGGGILVICYYWVVYDTYSGEILRIRLDHCESFMI